ncbi:MAG: LysM peptidoglycan-binding domain-containing protein, partial [Candidatus Contendobacter sp.]|nr:LysM peptidoglycan-binding domain-containing protein [Candidatus Contendobacter sp.]
MQLTKPSLSKWPFTTRLKTTGSILALMAGLAAAGVQAADQGPRHHAKGQYDTVTATYVVVEGDELIAIGERFEVPADALKAQNKLTSDEIKVGQKLVVAASAGSLKGQVLGGGAPIVNSTVTLWMASAGTPKQLAQVRTDADGQFALSAADAPDQDAVLYLVATGGHPTASKADGDNPAIALMTVLGSKPPETVIVNELTTVASAFTAARFINGEAISGNPLGLRIAAGNAPNLVDPVTGGWGKVLLDPLNSSMTTTMANLDTLGSLISAYFTVADDAWRARFLKAATPPSGVTPKNTLEAMAGIARAPWVAPKELYALFDEAYPLPAPDGRRSAPFAPYLVYAPEDFALSLAFSGGGNFANGRFMFDAEGNLWSGMNWMPGSQSGVNKSTGGGVGKYSPNGTALSPPIMGFRGMGIDGVGWGTAVTKDRVWISSFNGKILVMDFDGKPVASESDFPFKEKFLGLMGIGVADNGDVWIADGSDNQLLYFPGGRIKEGKIVKPAGLVSPFDIVIDSQNRVWVANSSSDTVVRFPANDPSKVETFNVGRGVRALALDSKENVWVANNMDLKMPVPKFPANASIMEQFKILTDATFKYIMGPPARITGQVNMIRPDGTQPAPQGFTGPAENLPWGINVDGNDDVWVGNMWGRSAALLAGDNTKGHPAGTKAGDVIHIFQSGSIQMITDVSIDPAGNVWVANNWNSLEGAAKPNPPGPVSTWGGGSGFTVIYGVAAPVKPPPQV